MDLYLSNKQREEIGFTYIVKQLELTSCFGVDYFKKLPIFTDETKLAKEFSNIMTTKDYLLSYQKVFKEVEVYLARFKNINSIVNNLGLACLDEVEIFEIKRFVYNVIKINEAFAKTDISLNDYKFSDYNDLFKILDPDNTDKPFFSISNKYDSNLETLRNEVKVNPSDELKNKIRELEYQIRAKLSDDILVYKEQLETSIIQIGYLDLLIAKAKLVIRYNLASPKIGAEIILEEGFNPYIQDIVIAKGYKYSKLNINIAKQIQIITGSNMSGKSVTLKTILLNCLCFHYGIVPFAKNSQFPLLDYIFFLSDELADVENSLSTFGKEVVSLNNILAEIEAKTGLFVIDELARGTNPLEAKMIVVGLCKYLEDHNSYTVLATHLDLELDINFKHYQVKGLSEIKEELLEKDDILKVMDYSLVEVGREAKVPNDAFKVMNLLNINPKLKEIIEIEYQKESQNGSN